MIPSNELRIGNWVNDFKGGGYNSPSYQKVTSIGVEGINGWHDMGSSGCAKFEDIEPMALTPELLVKIGFEKLPGSKFVYRIIVDDLEISISVDLFYAYIDTKWGQASIKKPIFKSLHQLQNLYFALTNSELPITNL
jgi:hypothetical protein